MKKLTCLELSVVAAGMEHDPNTVEFKDFNDWYKQEHPCWTLCDNERCYNAQIGVMKACSVIAVAISIGTFTMLIYEISSCCIKILTGNFPH